MKIKSIPLFLFLIFICITSTYAHPHMFFTSAHEFVWKEKKLIGCYLEWTFDNFFSADIINGYDFNHDGVFSKEETNAVYSNAFINLKNYHYFTFIRQGENRSNPTTVSDFSASQKNGLLVYRFFIDLSTYDQQDIYLAVYDYTYFCDVRYQNEDPVQLNFDNSKVTASFSIDENKEYPVYYNPMGSATDTTVYYEWKSGLMTYYPQEIHISYSEL